MARGEVTSSIIYSSQEGGTYYKETTMIELLIVVSSFFLSVWHEKAFFPPSPFFLLTGARSQHVRNPAAGCASELVRAESF